MKKEKPSFLSLYELTDNLQTIPFDWDDCIVMQETITNVDLEKAYITKEFIIKQLSTQKYFKFKRDESVDRCYYEDEDPYAKEVFRNFEDMAIFYEKRVS